MALIGKALRNASRVRSLLQCTRVFGRAAMHHPSCILFAVLALLTLTPGLQTKQQFRSEEFRVVYEWYKLDFTWPDESAKRSAFISRRFVPQNNIISGIKIWMHKVFLTLPRWKEGVPATLVTVPSIPVGPSASPRLEPFPSWEWQDINNCSALQNVHAVEIDLDGILWVVDSGTTNELEYPDYSCPPKLLQFNAETREHYYTYTFPPGTVNKDSILFDVVIDPKTRTAYISDSSETQPGIIVYREGVSYKVTGGISMQSDPSIGSIVVNGTEVRRQQNIGPLALSVVERVLYFSPVTSHHLYSVHLSALDRPGDISSSVRDLGRKLNSSSGMILDSKHVLYYGLLESNGIARWDSSRDAFSTGQRIITEDNALLQWPCAFAFDQQRALWVISNRFQTFLANTINLEVPNYRLIKAYTGTQSYLYANDPQSQPVSSSNALFANSILLLLTLYVSVKSVSNLV